MRRLLFNLIIFLCTTSLFAQPKMPKSLSNLDAYVSRVMQTFSVPGVGLAIVKDGKVLMAKGYGVRKLGELSPVDAQTLFSIASNTKAFTATALAILVAEGKLKWDAPVVDYLPWFQLFDPYVTHQLTVRDLLVHRSGLGLGAGDLLWYPASTYDRKEIARRLRFLPLVKSFRSVYAYDNVLYSVAGEIIEAVSGQSWEDFVTKRILDPVGMSNSNVRHSAIIAMQNVATPHAEINGIVRPVVPFTSDNVNPAGGIISCAGDMAQWMTVQLDSGRLPNGERLFPRATMENLWGFVTPIPIGDPPPELSPLRANFNGYGLGFGLRDYRGYKLVSHTGGLPGFLSRVTLIPEIKLGVTILTNQESGYAFNAITYYVLDKFLKAPSFDWLAAFQKIKIKADSTMAAREKSFTASRDSSSHSSLPLGRYAGDYVDAWYGDISISLEQGRLAMRFLHTPDLIGDLEHWRYDTFVVRWRDRELRADAFVTFALNPDGSIDQVKMRAVSPFTDFSFDFQDLLLKPVVTKKQE